MIIGRKIYLFLLCILATLSLAAAPERLLGHCDAFAAYPLRSERFFRAKRVEASRIKYAQCRPIYADVLKDILFLNLQLVSWDSYKIIVSSFPFYVASRMFDKDLQSHFYCKKHHKNINGLPSWCHKATQYTIALPVIALSSLTFLGVDEEMRLAGWTFLVGFPFLVLGSKISKRIQFAGCYRPWHEKFSCKSRSPGGFPSGHMAEVTYMAALFGMRYGPKWGMPLATYGMFVAVDFWTCNRHYLSQLVAGATWGLMYAFAANAFIDYKLDHWVRNCVTIDSNGAPAVGYSWQW